MRISKPITVFRTNVNSGHVGNVDKPAKSVIECAKGEANILWSNHESYKWVWENAIKDSITFYAEYDIVTDDYRVAVTAQFKPEDLTLYYLKFGV